MFELSLLCPEDRVETLSEAFDALEALSVSVEDADAQTDAEQALFGEPGMPAPREGWQRSRITALFATRQAADEAVQLLQVQDFFAGCSVLGIAAVQEQDWVRLTQSQFEPVLITSDFWIVPSWHKAPEGATRVMRLDPGLAFGTGTHPTTRMCLRWIARHADLSAPWPRVLDYGCGSGILAIAAARLGAGRVAGVDIDPQAVEAARANAERNGVAAIFADSAAPVAGEYDLVVANILSNPLRVLAPAICAHVRRGGKLALSGILAEQAAEIIGLYSAWLPLAVADTREGWVCLTGTKA